MTRLKTVALIVIAIVGLSLAGCPALMVGRLAYKGYEKDHESPTPTATPSDLGSQSNGAQ